MRYVAIIGRGYDSPDKARAHALRQAWWPPETTPCVYELGPEVKEPDAMKLADALRRIRNRGGCGCLPDAKCPQHIAADALKEAGL